VASEEQEESDGTKGYSSDVIAKPSKDAHHQSREKLEINSIIRPFHDLQKCHHWHPHLGIR